MDRASGPGEWWVECAQYAHGHQRLEGDGPMPSGLHADNADSGVDSRVGGATVGGARPAVGAEIGELSATQVNAIDKIMLIYSIL